MKSINKVEDLIPGNKFIHTGTYGPTRSGKSYKTKREMEEASCSVIYFNDPRKENDDYSIPGRRFSSRTDPEKVVQALRNGEKIRFKPSSDVDKAINQMKWLYSVTSKIEGRFVYYIDEAHRFNGKTLSTIIDDGAGNNVYFGLVTQYPKRILDGSKYGRYILQTIESVGIWSIFDVSSKQKGFFDFYDYDYDAIDRYTDEDYVFTVCDDDTILEPKMRV